MSFSYFKTQLIIFLLAGFYIACSDGTTSESSGSSSTGIGGSTAKMTIIGDTMYVIAGPEIKIIDIKDPENPSKAAIKKLDWDIETLFPFGDKLLIGSRTGVWIFDAKDPKNLKLLSQFSHARSCDPVVAKGNYAYVTLRSRSSGWCTGQNNQLDILDISNLEEPAVLHSYNLEFPYGLGVFDDKLFICDGEAGLKMFGLYGDVKEKGVYFMGRYPLQCSDVIPYSNKGSGQLIVTSEHGIYQFKIRDNHLDPMSLLPIYSIKTQTAKENEPSSHEWSDISLDSKVTDGAHALQLVVSEDQIPYVGFIAGSDNNNSNINSNDNNQVIKGIPAVYMLKDEEWHYLNYSEYIRNSLSNKIVRTFALALDEQIPIMTFKEDLGELTMLVFNRDDNENSNNWSTKQSSTSLYYDYENSNYDNLSIKQLTLHQIEDISYRLFTTFGKWSQGSLTIEKAESGEWIPLPIDSFFNGKIEKWEHTFFDEKHFVLVKKDNRFNYLFSFDYHGSLGNIPVPFDGKVVDDVWLTNDGNHLFIGIKSGEAAGAISLWKLMGESKWEEIKTVNPLKGSSLKTQLLAYDGQPILVLGDSKEGFKLKVLMLEGQIWRAIGRNVMSSQTVLDFKAVLKENTLYLAYIVDNDPLSIKVEKVKL